MIVCYRSICTLVSPHCLLCIVFILKTIVGLMAMENKHDAPFPQWMMVLKRNVTCGRHKVGLFPERTWSCVDIRVDGLPVVFGYNQQMANKKLCTDNNGTDNIGVICTEMLRSNGVYADLWAATISEPTCNRTTMARMSLQQINYNRYEWHKYAAGHGWMRALHCTIRPDVQ